MEICLSFSGIQDLCNLYHDEILQRKDLNYVLRGRRVRFINPEGKFDYTHFGNFFFEGNVMMLITNEIKYTIYHRPSQLSDTLWSTVPVIFAGIETRYKDDCGQDIFTGDVVSCEPYTSLVRYTGSSTTPSLAGDNCDVLFDEHYLPLHKLHKDGTAFTNVSPEMFKEFDPYFVYWATGGFSQFGPTFDEIKERAHFSMKVPTFTAELPKKNRRWRIYKDISTALRADYVLTYFCGDYEDSAFEDMEEDFGVAFYADNMPEDYDGKTYCIKLKSLGDDDLYKDLQHAINDFLLYAHRHPETTFVLCDFTRELGVPKSMRGKIALMFEGWFTYQIRNVVLPTWIFASVAAYMMIGRD